MNIPFTNKKMTGATGCLFSIGVLFVMGLIMKIGSDHTDEVSPLTIVLMAAVVLGAIVLLGKNANSKYADELEILEEKKKGLNDITIKYNKLVAGLEQSCNSQISTLASKKGKEERDIKKTFEKQYFSNKKDYEAERTAFLNQWKEKYGEPRLQRFWQWAISIGFIAILGACSFSMGVSLPPEPENAEMVELMESRSWGADNIPMPHMTNGDLYVSNPDSILSKAVEDSINVVLKELDNRLGIESAMVIVGHIKDDDPIAMVRGIYNKYKVGRNDRGLVIVVGYLDHSYHIATGRSLEADLTDLECNHLAQDYLIPSMKAEQPDSGMLYLAQGVLALMSKKEMPQMSALSNASSSDDISNEGLGAFALFIALLGGWGAYGKKMKRKLGLSDTNGIPLRSNPFFTLIDDNGGSGHGGYSGGSSYGSSRSSSSSWSSSSSSHSSGGYGGGSWGGGGSGGRW